jgi:hypothetical protein
MKVRKEVQEYPNKYLEEIFMDKLKKMIIITIKHSQLEFNKQFSKYIYFLIPC